MYINNLVIVIFQKNGLLMPMIVTVIVISKYKTMKKASFIEIKMQLKCYLMQLLTRGFFQFYYGPVKTLYKIINGVPVIKHRYLPRKWAESHHITLGYIYLFGLCMSGRSKSQKKKNRVRLPDYEVSWGIIKKSYYGEFCFI